MLRPEREAPDGRLEAELSRLFVEYRESLPDPDPAPEFLPGVWQRIEARRTSSRDLRRLASGFLTAAVLVSVLMGIFLTLPNGHGGAFYSNTYLELLAADQAQEDAAEVELVRVERAAFEAAP
jgi:hypothetical protein